MSHWAFVADGYRKSFGRKEVLRAASVWARPGSTTLLLGTNGSGKSTLLRCSVGMYRSAQGVTKVFGESIQGPQLWSLARLGVVFWPDHGLLSSRRSMSWHHALLDPERRSESVRRDPPVQTLSGGERKLAELEWIEALAPRVLLADEPLAGLDPKVQQNVADRVRALSDRGAAVVVTGHDARQLLDLADEVVWMAKGTTYALGTPQQAREHHQFRREYLGPSGS